MKKRNATFTETEMRETARVCQAADASNPFAFARKLNEFRRGYDDPVAAMEEAVNQLARRGASAAQIWEGM